MKRITMTVAVVAAGVTLVWLPAASAHGGAYHSGDRQSMDQQSQPGEQSLQNTGQQGRRMVESDFTATVTGQVRNVDPQSGLMTLDTPDGPINVRFPTVALQNVHEGDNVTFGIGLAETPAAASPPTSPDSSSQSSPGSSSGSTSQDQMPSGSSTR